MKRINFLRKVSAKWNLLVLICLFFTTSCIIQHPKYASFEDVQTVTTGMTLEALTDSLKVEPHYTKSISDSGTAVYVYKYRLCEVKRIPIIMRKNRGFNTETDFVDLLVTVNSDSTVTHIETCTNCAQAEEKTTVIDFEGIARGITTLITVTLPALIVFLSRSS